MGTERLVYFKFDLFYPNEHLAHAIPVAMGKTCELLGALNERIPTDFGCFWVPAVPHNYQARICLPEDLLGIISYSRILPDGFRINPRPSVESLSLFGLKNPRFETIKF